MVYSKTSYSLALLLEHHASYLLYIFNIEYQYNLFQDYFQKYSGFFIFPLYIGIEANPSEILFLSI